LAVNHKKSAYIGISKMLMNKLIVATARKLGVSPLYAHILLLLLVTLGFGFTNPLGWMQFLEPIFVLIWFCICAFVIFITWITKGKYRKYWTDAKYWKENVSE
jgi:hypothetical protein